MQRGSGRVPFLPKNVPCQAREVQKPENKEQTRKKESGGEVEVGRGGGESSPPKPILGSKSSYIRKNVQRQLRRWEWRDVMVGLEGRGHEPTQADARLEEVIAGKEQNHRFRL